MILKNGDGVIGLFEGIFEKIIITFNPGWDQNAQNVNPYDDVRITRQKLKAAGLSLSVYTDVNGSGPAYITLTDPDGNDILIDQRK